MQDIQLIGNKDHRITTTLPDLLAACEKAVLVDKVPIRKLRKRIKFFNAERLELGKTPAFGEELFTRKIIQRRPYKIGSDILEIMIKILKKEKLNWNQKLEIVQTKIKQLFTELISNRIMGENAQTVITKAVKSVLHNLSSKTKLENESIIVKNVNVKKFLDSTENNITMPISELYNICEFIIQNHTIDSLENLKTQFFSVEQLNKYVMNTAYGITAEGIAPDRDFTGKYQVPSVASLITAIARYLILSAEILYTINGGIPIYTDTDSIPTRAKKEVHKKIINYFSNTIRLQEERKFAKITKFYVTGKKKYGIQNEEGEIFTKIHGTGAYRDTKEFYKKLYDLKMNSKLPNEEIVKECLHLHPIAQSITYRSANDSKIKRMLGILKRGELLRSYQVFTGQSNLDLYVFKEQEDFLIINTKKLNKGMFGYYLNVERKSNSNLIIAIFAPCNFDEILTQIIDIERSSEIFTQIKYAKKSTERITRVYTDLTPILEALEVKVFVDPYTEEVKIEEEPFDTQNDSIESFEDFFRGRGATTTRYYRVLARALKETIERLGNLTFEDNKPASWNRVFSSLREENITPDEFLDRFQLNADRMLPNNLKFGRKLSEEHQKFMFFGIKDTDMSAILIKIHEKTKLYKKFMRYLEFDRSRFHRKRIQLPNKSYDLMIPKTYKKPIQDEPIKIYINNEKFSNDGWDCTYSTKLPALDFSAHGKSSETKYYSLAIQNICRHASVEFAKTHYTGIRKTDKIQEFLHETPLMKLPCPKGGKYNLNVLVPLKFQIKLKPQVKQIHKKDFILIFDIATIKNLVDRGIVHFDEKEEMYYILDFNKYARALRQAYKHEWMEVEWLNRKWSISIEDRRNMDYNAMLSIKMHVGLDRMFQASLRINPSSRNFYNMELFETCLKELDEGAGIGKIILKKLFSGNILSYFDQNRATHLEDLTETEKPYEAFKITYLTIAHKILKQKMLYLSSKIGIVSYTKNIEVKCPIEDLIPFIESIKLKEVLEVYESCKTETERINKMEEMSVTRHRFSTGFNINDYRNQTTVSIYGKTYYQHLGKIKRMLYANNLKELPKKPLTKLRHIKEYEQTSNILRLELTIRGWEKIHTQAFYHYLDRLEELIRDIDEEYYFKDENRVLSQLEVIQLIKDKARKKSKEISDELYHSLTELSNTEAIKPEYYNKYDRVNSINSKS